MCAGSIRVVHPLFQGEGGGSTPTSALQFVFSRIEKQPARLLNQLWHSRFPETSRSAVRLCHGATFDGLYYAVAIWTNPTSPKLPQRKWLLLSRWAIAPDAPKNTGTRMEMWMVRDIRRKLPEVTTLVSYSDADTHDGAIYKACNWTKGETTKRNTAGCKNWHNRERGRQQLNPAAENVTRWTKEIR